MNDDYARIRSFSWYRGNLDWLAKRTIFVTRHGSQAYGTNVEGSDLDVKGVAIAPVASYLGNLNGFEQAECHDPIDCTIFDIKKFFKLAAECNPNIIELLYTSPEDWIVHPGKSAAHCEPFPLCYAWKHIQDNRDLFLSQRAKDTFSGYAVAQMKRIRTHRKWLLEPPTHEPTRAEFGLPEASTIGKESLGLIEARVRKLGDVLGGEGLTKDEVEAMDASVVENAVGDLNLARELVPVIINERRYGGACRTWQQYQTWKKERNPARQELEKKYGYDTKHGMHLVRLMRMSHEILKGEGVLVRRPDAEELLAIRNGAWSYKQLETWAAEKEADLPAIKAGSPLPHEPNRKLIDSILVETVRQCI